MGKDLCKKCNGANTYWREDHPDTGMDEMVLACRDCESKIARLPWKFRMREKLSIKWKKIWGRYIVQRLFRLARWSTRQTHGYCTWCGSQPGFSSEISQKGLRCAGILRDCTKF